MEFKKKKGQKTINVHKVFIWNAARRGMEAFLLVVRRYDVVEQLENVPHCEEELQGAEKMRNTDELG